MKFIRNILLLFIINMGVVTASNAQRYDYNDAPPPTTYTTPHIDINRIRFGAFIAPNISWMHPTASQSDDGHYSVSSQGGKAGYTWGLMIDYFFTPNYGIATGFDINNTGGKITSSLTSSIPSNTSNTVLYSDFNYNFQYLEVPFNLKLRSDALNSTGISIFGQIGLTAGINISKKATFKVIYNDENADQQSLTGDNEKLQGVLSAAPLMLQLNIGTGIEYPIAQKLRFYTGLFFNNGFLPSAIEPQNYTLPYKGSFTNGNVRLNNFALKVGLFF